MDKLEGLPEDVATHLILQHLPDVPPLRQVVAFAVLHMLAIPLHVLLALTIILSTCIHRHSSSWVFFLSMAASSVCYTLLIFAGEPLNKHPSDGLRIASACLSIAAPLMQGGTLLALTMKIWAVLAEVLAAEPVKVLARLLTWDPLLLSFPWLIVLPVLAYSCAVARAAPVYAQRYYFYCTIYPSHNSIHESSMLIVVVLLALCVLFAVWALALFFSLGRSARRQLKIQTQLQRHAVNGDILLRVALYLVWIIMTLVVACVEYRTKTIHKSLAILTATDSLSSFVIFATQREMLSVWGLDGLSRFFGRCSHSHAQSHSHSSTLSSRSLDESSSSWLSNSRGRSQHSLSLSQSLSRSYSHSQSHPQLDTEGVNRLDSSDRRQFSKLSSIEDVDGSTIVNSQRGAQDSDGNEVKGREFGQAVSVVHKCTPEQPEHQKFPTLSNIDQAQSQTHNHTPNQTHTFTHSQPQYTHNRQNSSNTTYNSHYSHVPPRKPVPSFASYELPAVALTSPSGSIYGRRSERQWSNNQSHNSHNSHNSHSHPL